MAATHFTQHLFCFSRQGAGDVTRWKPEEHVAVGRSAGCQRSLLLWLFLQCRRVIKSPRTSSKGAYCSSSKSSEARETWKWPSSYVAEMPQFCIQMASFCCLLVRICPGFINKHIRVFVFGTSFLQLIIYLLILFSFHMVLSGLTKKKDLWLYIHMLDIYAFASCCIPFASEFRCLSWEWCHLGLGLLRINHHAAAVFFTYMYICIHIYTV